MLRLVNATTARARPWLFGVSNTRQIPTILHNTINLSPVFSDGMSENFISSQVVKSFKFSNQLITLDLLNLDNELTV